MTDIVPKVSLNNGVEIPQLGFGVFRVPPPQTQAIVEDALDVGYRHLDTATIYGNEAGVGAAIRASGIPRGEIFLTTKLWNDRHRAKDVPGAIEYSLEQLGTDYVDLYLIHWPLPMHGAFVDVWHGLEDLLDQGVVRAIGVSNFTIGHLETLLSQARVVPALNQTELHPRFAQPELRAYEASKGIATEAWGPLGQGRYALGELPAIAAAAAAHGRTPTQVVLRWHLQSGIIAIPKASSRAHIEENFDVFDFELSADELAAIDALDSGERLASDPETFDL